MSETMARMLLVENIANSEPLNWYLQMVGICFCIWKVWREESNAGVTCPWRCEKEGEKCPGVWFASGELGEVSEE
jgi:hypothetical protein